MANINLQTMRPSPFRPPRVYVPVEKVGLVDAQLPKSAAPAQPTTQDVLNVIQDLSKKISQLSKNQQILETKLDNIQKSLAAVDTNVISGAQWNAYVTNYFWAIGTPGQKSDIGAKSPEQPIWA